MKTKSFSIANHIGLVAMALLAAVFAAEVPAQVPGVISYQGRVRVAGTDFTGTGQFKFALVDPGVNTNRTATATATVSGGRVNSIGVTFAGLGYASAPAVTITGTGSGATAQATVAGGRVTSIQVLNTGSGYVSAPQIRIEAPLPGVGFITYWSNDGSSAAGGEPATAVQAAVADGLFTVLLGDAGGSNMIAIPSAVFTNRAVRLRLWFSDGVQGFGQLTPDQHLGSVGYAMIAQRAVEVNVGTTQLVDGAVTAEKLADGVITSVKITDGTITTDDLVPGIFENLWQLGGNSVAPGQFLGSTNDQPVELHVNGERALRLESDGLNAVNVIGGWMGNSVAPGLVGATISGGGGRVHDNDTLFPNSISAPFGTIGGGRYITIGTSSTYCWIGGGFNNHIRSNASLATIAGGNANFVYTNAERGTISGGGNNSVRGFAGTVGGGDGNASIGRFATIPGGLDNRAAGHTSFAAGWRANASHDGAFVWADSTDADFTSTTSNQFLIRASGGVAIGTNDPAGAMLRVAGMIQADGFLGMGSTLMLGTTDNQPLQLKVNNEVGLRLEYPTAGTVPNLVGGYSGNSVGAGTAGAVIAGGGTSGFENTIGVNADYSAIGGGFDNNIASNSFSATIAGGYLNGIGVDSDSSAIGGGQNNNIADNSIYATIAGGRDNDIGVNADYSAIGGGQNNNIASNSVRATIAGGWDNDIGVDSDYSAIGGGQNNNIASNSVSATIAGGWFNDIGVDSDNSAIGGGFDNNIASNAAYATIPGGHNNAATNYAFAAGRRAKANHTGTFVWADSANADFASTGSNQFLIRASGGVGIGTTDPQNAALYVFQSAAGAVTPRIDTPLVMESSENNHLSLQAPNNRQTGIIFASPLNNADGGLYYNSSTPRGFQFRTGGNTTRLVITATGDVGIGANTPGEKLHVAGNILATGTITPNSDRHAKTDVQPVDPAAILERVTRLPIQQWRFKAESAHVKHVGPMAQDFRAAFGLGAHETAIATVDADGVALAAIQGLNQKLEQRLEQKQTEITGLQRRLEALEQLIAQSRNHQP